jgi:hypothetical protein
MKCDSGRAPLRLTDAEMRDLMINTSEKLAKMLTLRDTEPAAYQRFIHRYALNYCRRWNR